MADPDYSYLTPERLALLRQTGQAPEQLLSSGYLTPQQVDLLERQMLYGNVISPEEYQNLLRLSSGHGDLTQAQYQNLFIPQTITLGSVADTSPAELQRSLQQAGVNFFAPALSDGLSAQEKASAVVQAEKSIAAFQGRSLISSPILLGGGEIAPRVSATGISGGALAFGTPEALSAYTANQTQIQNSLNQGKYSSFKIGGGTIPSSVEYGGQLSPNTTFQEYKAVTSGQAAKDLLLKKESGQLTQSDVDVYNQSLQNIAGTTLSARSSSILGTSITTVPLVYSETEGLKGGIPITEMIESPTGNEAYKAFQTDLMIEKGYDTGLSESRQQVEAEAAVYRMSHPLGSFLDIENKGEAQQTYYNVLARPFVEEPFVGIGALGGEFLRGVYKTAKGEITPAQFLSGNYQELQASREAFGGEIFGLGVFVISGATFRIGENVFVNAAGKHANKLFGVVDVLPASRITAPALLFAGGEAAYSAPAFLSGELTSEQYGGRIFGAGLAGATIGVFAGGIKYGSVESGVQTKVKTVLGEEIKGENLYKGLYYEGKTKAEPLIGFYKGKLTLGLPQKIEFAEGAFPFGRETTSQLESRFYRAGGLEKSEGLSALQKLGSKIQYLETPKKNIPLDIKFNIAGATEKENKIIQGLVEEEYQGGLKGFAQKALGGKPLIYGSQTILPQLSKRSAANLLERIELHDVDIQLLGKERFIQKTVGRLKTQGEIGAEYKNVEGKIVKIIGGKEFGLLDVHSFSEAVFGSSKARISLGFQPQLPLELKSGKLVMRLGESGVRKITSAAQVTEGIIGYGEKRAKDVFYRRPIVETLLEGVSSKKKQGIEKALLEVEKIFPVPKKQVGITTEKYVFGKSVSRSPAFGFASGFSASALPKIKFFSFPANQPVISSSPSVNIKFFGLSPSVSRSSSVSPLSMSESLPSGYSPSVSRSSFNISPSSRLSSSPSLLPPSFPRSPSGSPRSRSPSIPSISIPSLSPSRSPFPSPSPSASPSPSISPPPNLPFKFPLFSPPRGGYGVSGSGRNISKAFARLTKYQPDFTSLALNIHGKKPKQIVFTGAELRPIVSGNNKRPSVGQNLNRLGKVLASFEKKKRR